MKKQQNATSNNKDSLRHIPLWLSFDVLFDDIALQKSGSNDASLCRKKTGKNERNNSKRSFDHRTIFAAFATSITNSEAL